ncbi:hypothetical protein ACFPOE_17345 [Caenimonas terrae]|uniref:Uncharacterized protein n=1 Tax=Caenimonas terrae TaxID=696074 RepID=A0ABW0NK55_9BURK
MKPWKLVLGAAAACAACCAAPIIGGIAALGAGSGLFAGGVGVLSAATRSWWPLAAGAAVLAAATALVAWRRQRATGPAAGCGCSGGSAAGASCRTKVG